MHGQDSAIADKGGTSFRSPFFIFKNNIINNNLKQQLIMKKNDVFQMKFSNGTPDGYEVKCVVLSAGKTAECREQGCVIKNETEYICYGDNKLFTAYEDTYFYKYACGPNGEAFTTSFRFGDFIVDNAILPDYDALLDNHNCPENNTL